MELRVSISNLSTGGMWVDTTLALEPGSEVIVRFTPPGDLSAEPLWAAARVVRVQVHADYGVTGMGLAFTYCSERDLRRLARALLGRPPRLPLRIRLPPPLPLRRALASES